MINTAVPASNSVYGREKLFWYDKINFSNLGYRCGAVVKGVCTLFSVSLYRFFFFYCFVSFFNTIFRFGLFFLYSYCLTCWSCTWINMQNMILLLSPGFILEKGFQNLLICILVKLTTRKKNISCQDISLLWNSWIFFNVSWHHDKQHTVHHKLCSFTPKTQQWPTGES